MRKILTLILLLILAAAVAAIGIPYVLMMTTEPFQFRGLYSILFSLAALERTWSMFSRIRMRDYMEIKSDWTAVGVGLAYAAVFYVSLFEFYRHSGIRFPAVSVTGITAYLGAVALRYWAFHHLKHQWAVHVDKSDSQRFLVQTGPYRLVRHPLYTGACLEALALPIAFNAWTALAISCLIYIPLEVYRAYFEERYLLDLFANSYREYAARTWAFVPLPFGKSHH